MRTHLAEVPHWLSQHEVCLYMELYLVYPANPIHIGSKDVTRSCVAERACSIVRHVVDPCDAQIVMRQQLKQERRSMQAACQGIM